MQHTLPIGGIVVPLPSPCDEKQSLCHTALATHFKALMATDIDGMYLCGGTGDAEKLTTEERIEIAAMLVPALKQAGKSAIVHVGQTNERTAVQLAMHAGTVGADAVAAIPPRGGWAAAQAYYRALAATRLPVYIYYIPGITGVSASLPDLAALLEIPGIAGIKVSDWNVFLIQQIKQAFPKKCVFTGYDEMLLPGLLYGANGSIGTWANLFPQLYCRLYRLATAGQWQQAQQLSYRFTAFLAKGWHYGILPLFEAMMQTKGVQRCFRDPPSWPAAVIPSAVLAQLLQEAGELEAAARYTGEA